MRPGSTQTQFASGSVDSASPMLTRHASKPKKPPVSASWSQKRLVRSGPFSTGACSLR